MIPKKDSADHSSRYRTDSAEYRCHKGLDTRHSSCVRSKGTDKPEHSRRPAIAASPEPIAKVREIVAFTLTPISCAASSILRYCLHGTTWLWSFLQKGDKSDHDNNTCNNCHNRNSLDHQLLLQTEKQTEFSLPTRSSWHLAPKIRRARFWSKIADTDSSDQYCQVGRCLSKRTVCNPFNYNTKNSTDYNRKQITARTGDSPHTV